MHDRCSPPVMKCNFLSCMMYHVSSGMQRAVTGGCAFRAVHRGLFASISSARAANDPLMYNTCMLCAISTLSADSVICPFDASGDFAPNDWDCLAKAKSAMFCAIRPDSVLVVCNAAAIANAASFYSDIFMMRLFVLVAEAGSTGSVPK